MTQHKDDCPWQDGYHQAVWHRSGQWEYDLIVDEEGLFYGVKHITGLHPVDTKPYRSEYFKYKFCPMCGVEITEEEE